MCVRNRYNFGGCFKSEGLLPSLGKALYSQNSPVLSEYKSLYSHCLHKTNKHCFSPFALNTFCYTSCSQDFRQRTEHASPLCLCQAQDQEVKAAGVSSAEHFGCLIHAVAQSDKHPFSHYQEKPVSPWEFWSVFSIQSLI